MTEQDLLDLKEKVDAAKTAVSELTGQKTALMKQLKDDWDCSTIEEAEEKITSMEERISTLDKKIKKSTEELEAKINKDGN